MHFGKRNIRSAGRSSGSIEITLPVEFAILEGVSCRLDFHDGLMPQITLQPDLKFVTQMYLQIWELLALGLEKVGNIGDYSDADYQLGLFHNTAMAQVPPLSYADAIAVLQKASTDELEKQRAFEAYARIVESMATVGGFRLSLSPTLATLFGNQVAYYLCGEVVDARDAFARGIGLRQQTKSFGIVTENIHLDTAYWLRIQDDLMCIYDRFAGWNRNPTAFDNEREHWYRARRFEVCVEEVRA
jgi:hypothetical protein